MAVAVHDPAAGYVLNVEADRWPGRAQSRPVSEDLGSSDARLDGSAAMDDRGCRGRVGNDAPVAWLCDAAEN